MDQKDKKNISSSSYDVVEIEDDSAIFADNIYTVHTCLSFRTKWIGSSNGKLPRTIGFFTGTMICVGSSVGSGIFSVPAIILGEVGSVGMTIICFLLASMIAFFGTLAYCEMGCMRPVSGGEKEYLDYAFKKPKQMLSYMFVTSAVRIYYFELTLC